MYKKPNTLDTFFKMPNPGLRAYLQHVESGNPDDYRTPFCKGATRAEVLDQWQAVLDSLHVKEKYPKLYDYEEDMKSKVGPLSIQQPLNKRLETIEAYYSGIDLPRVSVDERAIQATIRKFSRAGGVRLRSLKNTVLAMRLDTNSGAPYFTKRRLVVDQTLKDPISLSSDLGYLGEGDWTLPAVLGWRGQEHGPKPTDVKQRVVFMMPFLLNIMELSFYQPLIQAFQRYNLIPAYVSNEAVDREVTALFDSKLPGDPVICTDFTAFDQHFNSVMQESAEKIERALVGPWDVKARAWFAQVYPKKFNIPLVCSKDLTYFGPHGMGSGSGGTNMDESLAHSSLQQEAAILNHTTLNEHSMAYGDDGVLTFPGITVDKVTRSYTSHGLEMNLSKQYSSEHDCVYLRRWHGDSYRVGGIMVGVYSTFRALGRLLGQERYYDPEVWGKEMVCLRMLSILENCKWAPYFHQFVDWVMSRDKYRLGLDIPGFYEHITQTARKATDIFTDFLGYNRANMVPTGSDAASGINDWAVVRYVRSKG